MEFEKVANTWGGGVVTAYGKKRVCKQLSAFLQEEEPLLALQLADKARLISLNSRYRMEFLAVTPDRVIYLSQVQHLSAKSAEFPIKYLQNIQIKERGNFLTRLIFGESITLTSNAKKMRFRLYGKGTAVELKELLEHQRAVTAQ